MKSYGIPFNKIFLILLLMIVIVFTVQSTAYAYYGMFGLNSLYGLYGGMYGLGGGLGLMGLYSGWTGLYPGSGLTSLSGFGGMGSLLGLYGMYGMGGLYGMYGMGNLYGYGTMLSGLVNQALYGSSGLYGLGGLGLYGGLYGLSGLGGLSSLGLLGGLFGLDGTQSTLSSLLAPQTTAVSPATIPTVTAPTIFSPVPVPVFLAEQVGTWLGIWTTGLLSGQMTMNLIEDPLLGTLLGTVQLLGNPTLSALVDVTGEALNAQVILSGSAIGLGGMTFGIEIVGILTAPNHMIGSYNLINLSSGGTIVETGSIDLTLIAPII